MTKHIKKLLRFVKRLNYDGQDYAVELLNIPSSCPNCRHSLEGWKFAFNLIEEESDLFFLSDKYPVHNRRAGIYCSSCNNLILGSATINLYEEWVTEEMNNKNNNSHYSKNILKQIVLIRRIQSHIDIYGEFTEQEPSNDLIIKSFLPGKMIKKDIWIANNADVSKRAKLNPPLLIGNGCRIEAGAICGPRSIIVKNSEIENGMIIAHCIFDRSVEVHNFIKR